MNRVWMFDFDGTLVDSLQVYHQVHREFGKRCGIPLFEEQSQFLDLYESNFMKPSRGKGIPGSIGPHMLLCFMHF